MVVAAMPEDPGDFKLHPFLYKRFIQALARAAKKRKKPKLGHRVRCIPGQIYTFQEEVLKRKAPPKLLREELNALQRRINHVINEEKYVVSIHEEEHEVLGKLAKKLQPLSKEIGKKLKSLNKKKENLEKTTIGKEKKKVILLPPPPDPILEDEKETLHQRFITQLADQLQDIEAHHKKLSKRKTIDKKKLAQMEKTIKKFKAKLSELKDKHLVPEQGKNSEKGKKKIKGLLP